MSKHYKPVICPHCGKYNDCAANLPGQEGTPDDGSISMCIGCGEFAMFDRSAGGGLRKPNGEERFQLSISPAVNRARVAFAMMQAGRMLDER